MPKWLEDAIFYDIYPPSFMDADGDGIGDFEGIIQKLDYIKELGCNGLWLNPCVDLPQARLFTEAHQRGIRVLLTLKPLKRDLRFWLDEGCDGFMVDLKQDAAAKSLCRDLRAMLDQEYPEAVMISRWNNPSEALKAGFHLDFLSAFFKDSGYKSLLRDYDPADGSDHSFFKKDGQGDIQRFLQEYLFHYNNTKDLGYISLVTGNHDLVRLRHTLSPQELTLVYAFIFTMPGAPFLYYGDEIGMRYLEEGGSRTPMQWEGGKNWGFSRADPQKLYLPVDPAPDAPTVENQEKTPDSLLNILRDILWLRRTQGDLQSKPNLEILYAEKGKMPFIYRRGSFIIGVNPGETAVKAPIKAGGKPVYALGNCGITNRICHIAGQSFGIWYI